MKMVCRAIEIIAILVAIVPLMIIEEIGLAAISGLIVASLLWTAKTAIFGEDKPEPINTDEIM